MCKRMFAILLSLILCFQMVFAGVPVVYAEDGDTVYGLHYPSMNDTGYTFDCVYFGSYPQSLKAGAKVGSQNLTDYNVEPIKWRVVDIQGNHAMLVSDQVLDIATYGSDLFEIVWSNSQLRSWLNGYSASYNFDGVDYQSQNFINTAFTSDEVTAIVPYEYTDSHLIDPNPTTDKINVWSVHGTCGEWWSEVMDEHMSLERIKTDYACSGGTVKTPTDGYYSDWWETEGTYFSNMRDVSSDNREWRPAFSGVCPMIVLDLTKTNVWTKAESVTVNDYYCFQYSDKTSISNPVISADGSVQYDCVYFGNYPQTLIDSTNEGSTNEADYAVEPIMWRVLEVKNNKALLVADSILDVKSLSEAGTAYSFAWKYSEIRSWLNGYGKKSNNAKIDYSKDCFLKKAFNSAERKAIVKTKLKNSDNPVYLTDCGPNTTDKVFLLSFADVTNKKYGFLPYNKNSVLSSPYKEFDYATMRKQTDFAKNTGRNATSYRWALRSVGGISANYTFVEGLGRVAAYGSCVAKKFGICPALTLDLSKTNCWSYAGTVTTRPPESSICKHSYETKKIIAEAVDSDTSDNSDCLGGSIKICKYCHHVKSATKYYGRVTIALGKKSYKYFYKYTGKNIKPKVIVYDGFGKKLKKGKDYTVSYEKKCKKKGTHKVKIKFKGRFKGTLYATYEIIK